MQSPTAFGRLELEAGAEVVWEKNTVIWLEVSAGAMWERNTVGLEAGAPAEHDENNLHNYSTVACVVANKIFDRIIREWLDVVTVALL